MTWIRTLDGTLVNADFLSAIERRGNVLVVLDARGRRFDLTPALPGDAADTMLDHLANRLPLSAVQLIDVRRIAEELFDEVERRRIKAAWDRALAPEAV
jgi:hypothetical protein